MWTPNARAPDDEPAKIAASRPVSCGSARAIASMAARPPGRREHRDRAAAAAAGDLRAVDAGGRPRRARQLDQPIGAVGAEAARGVARVRFVHQLAQLAARVVVRGAAGEQGAEAPDPLVLEDRMFGGGAHGVAPLGIDRRRGVGRPAVAREEVGAGHPFGDGVAIALPPLRRRHVGQVAAVHSIVDRHAPGAVARAARPAVRRRCDSP